MTAVKTRTSIEEAQGLIEYFDLLAEKGYNSEVLKYPLYKKEFIENFLIILQNNGIFSSIKETKSSYEISFSWFVEDETDIEDMKDLN